MADDALKAITTLLEIVPKWIADLESILETSTARQNEILFERQPADSPAPSLRKEVSKSSSLRSRPSALQRPQLPHLTNSEALLLSQRKRKTTSACSDQQSGPSKYRSRAMAVVYYDGDIQTRLDILVRSIGTCRNAIRKGKMGAQLDTLSETGSTSSEASDSSAGEEGTLDLSKLGYRSTREKPLSCPSGKHDGAEAFDKADACLERGQSLCERAAHQLLRDGDCSVELHGATEQFDEAEVIAKGELPALRKRVEKAVERQRRSEERQRVKEEAEQEKEQADATLPHTRSSDFVHSLSPDGKLEVDLEADDSDGGGDDFVLDTMQLGKYQMRSTRLMVQ